MTSSDTIFLPPLTDREKMRGIPWLLSGEAFSAFFSYITFASSVFVLYFNDLGYQKTFIGFLLSLFPFCGLVAPFLASWIARVGPRRIFFIFYGARKLVIMALLATPWVMTSFGARAGAIFVAIVILTFALCRAIAETGFYPWNQECIPNAIRGKVGGINSTLAMITSMIALGLASYIIGKGTGLWRYSLIIAIGAAAGIISVLLRLPVPGGRPAPHGKPEQHADDQRAALRDPQFRRFLIAIGCLYLGMAVTAFLPLYMKEQVGLAPARVVQLDMASMAGIFLAGYLAGWLSDRVGGKQVLVCSLALMALLPIAWLLMPRHSAWSFPAAITLAVCWGVAYVGMGVGSGRLLFNRVIPLERTAAYSAIWYAVIGLAGGIASLVTGRLLDACSHLNGNVWGMRLDLYTPIYLVGTLLLIASASMFNTIKADTP